MVHWREQLAIVFSPARFSSTPFPSSAKVNNFHTGSGTHGHTDTFKRTVSLIKKQGKFLRYTCLLVISHQRNYKILACIAGYCNFFLKEHRRQTLSRVPGVLIVVPPRFSLLSSIQFFFTPFFISSCSPLTLSLEQTDSLPILPLVYP